MLAHIKINFVVFEQKSPEKTQCRETDTTDEGFILLCNSEIWVQSRDAQLEIQTTSKSGKNYLGEITLIPQATLTRILFRNLSF